MVGSTVKIRQGHFKGYRGRVVDVKGQSVRIELESQMKVVTGKSYLLRSGHSSFISCVMFLCLYCCFSSAVNRTDISDNVVVATPYR